MPDKNSLNYRPATSKDLDELKQLAIKSWSQFKTLLTNENWKKLNKTLTNSATFIELLDKSDSVVCTTDKGKIVGMAFLIPKGNPTDIYDKDWCSIRFVTVDPDFAGRGIGRKLTTICIDKAIQNGEKTIALHTSELMSNARQFMKV